MTQPSTKVTRLGEKQDTSRRSLDGLLDSTPLATVSLVRDGHPVDLSHRVRPDRRRSRHSRVDGLAMDARAGGGCACGGRGDRTGWCRGGAQRIRIVVPLPQCRALFGVFERVPAPDKLGYLEALTDKFIPGRVAELRASTRKELAATMALRMPIGPDNWSLKVSAGWPDDPEDDVASGAWAGVVPMTVTYGAPLPAPDCDPSAPLPESVRLLSGSTSGNAPTPR